MRKCKVYKKLDLSWSIGYGSELSSLFSEMLKENSKTLTHISLGNCTYVSLNVIQALSTCIELHGNIFICKGGLVCNLA